ncbi:MAG: transcription termination factor NusA [Solobacterium sp.]|nr:transcription termination factor NusA [Solobacterium sp.]MDD7775164.1 transcription termination factor NusA [Solobacterium sp.]MDY2953071.1 transcription termination factor NusA [Erysipelotrichaceae bacterium]
MNGVNLKNNKNFLEGMRLFEEERKIPAEFVIETLKEAIIKTYQNHVDAPAAKVRVEIDSKGIQAYHELLVVDDDSDTFDETLDILYSDAKEIKPDVKVGDTIEEEINFAEISRTAINVAKNMLKQKTKEFDKQRVYDEYKDKEYDLISGVIETVEEKFVLVDIKNTFAILKKSDQIPGEVYREGNPIKAIIKEVSKSTKGSQVVLSRADAKFVERLFEKEVPEIQQGLVEIKAIAREAGERTKMAVYSRNEDVDAIGSCIGPRGSRVQAVISEVKGEKVDVFEWNDDIGELVKNALAPAEVKACFYSNEKIDPSLTEEELEKLIKRNQRPLCVVVDDDKLSIAIGKKGKNVKLAYKLTNRKIDIKTEEDVREAGVDIESEEAFFKEDQLKIKKEKEQKEFLQLQEEAAKRKAESGEEEVVNDDAFVEFEETLDEVTIEDVPNQESLEEKEKEETPVEEETGVESDGLEYNELESVEEEKEVKSGLETGLESESKPSKKLVPHTDYVSKFEDFAGAGKKEEKVTKKRKKKDDDDRRLRGENLEKKEYDEDVKPTYSEEELEEIRQQEEELEEDSWINDDDIDFDEYDEYYDEEN